MALPLYIADFPPDENGCFEEFGGMYVPEILAPVVQEVQKAFAQALHDPTYWEQLAEYRTSYIGRPSPLMHAKRVSKYFDKAQVYFKREELNHTGSHKINNCLGQILLALRMGKKTIIAETGAGQHGVATASVCALFDLPCIVFMGTTDIARQKANVGRMRLLGAEVREVSFGKATLKEAMNEAIRYWATNPQETYYAIGTAAGPHPYPYMVRCLQSIIGIEAKEQMFQSFQRLPTHAIACIGGGSNAAGLFSGFIQEKVKLIGVEAAGKGLDSGYTAASISRGSPAVIHGNKSYYLQHEGNITEAHSISAGLDYPGIGPEHAHWHKSGRVQYVAVTDQRAISAGKTLAKLEGILPALEPAHALAYLFDTLLPNSYKDEHILVNVCGRGDKDLETYLSAE